MSDLYKQKIHQSKYHNVYKQGDKVVVVVHFSNGGKTYCYDADPGRYFPGDKVLVKVDEGYKDVTVDAAYYYNPEDYPFTSFPLKRIEARLRQDNYTAWPKTTSKSSNKDKTISRNETKAIDVSGDISAIEHHDYASQSYNVKTGINKKLIVLAIIVIIGILQGPTWYRNHVDSKPLDKSEIIGTWHGYENVHFRDDNTFTVDTVYFLTGEWEIVNKDENFIKLNYYVTENQLDSYNEEYQYEMDGYLATKEDVLEWEEEACASEIPPEGIYKFKRSDNRLILVDDYGDYYLYRKP